MGLTKVKDIIKVLEGFDPEAYLLVRPDRGLDNTDTDSWQLQRIRSMDNFRAMGVLPTVTVYTRRETQQERVDRLKAQGITK